MSAKPKADRSDRFGAPEGAESAKLSYRDKTGQRLSATDWLEKVKADSKKAKKT